MNPTIRHFLRGMGSILNILPDPRNVSKPLPSEEEMMREDFALVGASLYRAIEQYRKESREQEDARYHAA